MQMKQGYVGMIIFDYVQVALFGHTEAEGDIIGSNITYAIGLVCHNMTMFANFILPLDDAVVAILGGSVDSSADFLFINKNIASQELFS